MGEQHHQVIEHVPRFGDSMLASGFARLAGGLDPRTALRLGVLCASDSVTRPGTQTSFPRGEQAERLVRLAAQPST